MTPLTFFLLWSSSVEIRSGFKKSSAKKQGSVGFRREVSRQGGLVAEWASGGVRV
jgi:hypothetical protein